MDAIYLSMDKVDFKTKPQVTLQVNNQMTLFLADSGADRTVLKECQWYKQSSEKISVVSANGQIKVSPLSVPLHFQIQPNSEGVMCKAVLLDSCPHNLLGRDVLAGLGLAIVPLTNGSMGVVHSDYTNSDCALHVLESRDSPYYWWSLDIPSSDPSQTAKTLLSLADNCVRGGAVFMNHSNLHVTLRYNHAPGPDPRYDSAIHSLGPTLLTIPYLYFRDQTACTDVQIPEKAKMLMHDSETAHISLARDHTDQWNDLKYYLSQIKRITDWFQTRDTKTDYSGSTGWYRLRLNMRVTATPSVHLRDQD